MNAFMLNGCVNFEDINNVTYPLKICGGSSPSLVTQDLSVNGKITGAVNVVSWSATPAFNINLGNTQKITLTGNVTSSTLSNCAAGEWLTFDIIEDATGGRTFVWPTNIKGVGTISTTANAHNRQMFYCDGTNAWATSTMQSGT